MFVGVAERWLAGKFVTGMTVDTATVISTMAVGWAMAGMMVDTATVTGRRWLARPVAGMTVDAATVISTTYVNPRYL